MIYRTQWCAAKHPVYLSERSVGTCDAFFLCVSHTLQSALETRQDTEIVHIDFSATFDRVKHQGILYMLCGYLNIYTLSNKSIKVCYSGRLSE